MKVVAIETATPSSSVALGDGRRLEAMSVQVDRRGHVGFLISALQFCFERAGWERSEIDAVVVDVGPGLFTGIRAGVATAQGIAAAVGVPVVPVTSLDALALRAATGHRCIWPVVDARRGEVATAPYRPVPGGVIKDGPPELVAPEKLRAMLQTDPDNALVVGDWESLPEDTLRGISRVRTGRPRYPSAEILIEIAAMRLSKDDFGSAAAIRPLYLRQPDAAINWSDFREEGMWPGSESA